MFLCKKCRALVRAEGGEMVDCPNCGHTYHFPATPPEPAITWDDSAVAWQRECELAAVNAARLLKLAKRNKYAESTIIEIFRTAPRSGDEFRNLDKESLLFRLFMEAKQFSEPELEQILSVVGYFVDYLTAMPFERRAMLEASVIGVLLGGESG